jgi:dephospho-CoA kinase
MRAEADGRTVITMLKVALTGGIATGKSYVLARLKDRNIPTIDADDIVHEALGSGTPTSKAIAAKFGEVFLKADGSVHRARLGEEVFRDPEARRQVEAIVHPVVWETIHKWFDTVTRPLGVASIPLLYETKHEGDFDFVVVTLCPPEVQLQRILDRDLISEEQALQRIAAQIPAEEKARRANFVIQTGGTKAVTDRQVDELVSALRIVRSVRL